MGEFVQVEAAPGESGRAVATIRLDRPPMNALSYGLLTELGAAAEQVSQDPEVRAVILYGGDKIFAAGADIKEMSDGSYAAMTGHIEHLQGAFAAVAGIGKPVIAAITRLRPRRRA